MKLNGSFQITDWKEDTVTEFADGSKQNAATVKQQYKGDIIGISTVHYSMYYSNNGDAKFVGFERLDATINGVTAQLLLKHDGNFKQGMASSKFIIVDCDTEKKMIGLSGSFDSTEGGQANYNIS